MTELLTAVLYILTEELDARGWDLTTLRVSIKRKARPTTGDTDDRT